MLAPLDEAERRARALTRRLLLAAAGAIFVAVGLGFLTASGWTLLATAGGPVLAATILGAVYLTAGLGMFVMARSPVAERRPAAPPPEPDPYEPFVHMAEGFAAGLEAGRAARRPNGHAHR